jgi:rhodanese-related sulfurtransferase
MDIFQLFKKDACDVRGKCWSDKRTWNDYFTYKKELEVEWKNVVLVDMIGHPVEWAVSISNELFFSGSYPEGTIFVLYCHSGGSSGYVQKQLKPALPQYTIINMEGGIWAYRMYQMNN